MGTQVVAFAFLFNADSFSAVTGTSTVGSWQSDPEDVGGYLRFRISGRSKTNANNTYSRSLTFEQMGVPAGATVTGITGGSARYRVFEWNAGNVPGNNSDGVFLTHSGGTITIAAGTAALNGLSSWTTYNGTDATGLSLPSSTLCTVTWRADLSTGPSGSAYVSLGADDFTFTVQYGTDATANPTTVVGTGAVSVPTVSANGNISATIAGVAGTGAAGDVGVTSSTSVSITGVSTAGSAGSLSGTSYGPGLLLPLSLNLDFNNIFSVEASASGVAGTGSAGTVNASTVVTVSAEPSGVFAVAYAAIPQTSVNENLGSWLIFSSLLEPYVPGEYEYKYSSDTWTPTFTEDDVDEWTIEDDTERFVPVFLETFNIGLGQGVSAAIPTVSATASIGTLEARFGSSVTIRGVDAVSDVSTLITVRYSSAVTLEGVAGVTSLGTVSFTGGLSVSTSVSSVVATGAVGTPTVSNEAVFVTGASAIGSVGSMGIEAGNSVSVAIDSVPASGAVGTLYVSDDAVSISGVSATGYAEALSVEPVASTSAVPFAVSGTGSVGSITVSVFSTDTVSITGVEGTTGIGTLIGTVPASASVTGVNASGSAGNVTHIGTANVSVSGVGGTGTAAGMIINPGEDGMPIRRAYPGRRRVVRVAR